MNDLKGPDGVSDEDDDLFQSSSDIEVQLDGLQYEENKEQASIPPKESLCYSFLSPLLSKNQRPYDTSIVWQPFLTEPC